MHDYRKFKVSVYGRIGRTAGREQPGHPPAPGVLERFLAVGGLGGQHLHAGLSTQRAQHRQRRRLLALLRHKQPAVQGQLQQPVGQWSRVSSSLSREVPSPRFLTKAVPGSMELALWGRRPGAFWAS